MKQSEAVPSVFISYRSSSGAIYAETIHDFLCDKGIGVFWDVESMHDHSGPFPAELRSRIQAADDFILILSDECFNIKDPENSFFVREIQCAMEKGKNLIPVYCGGFSFPRRLPESVKTLPEYTALTLHSRKQAGDRFFEELLSKMTPDESVQKALDAFVSTPLESRAVLEARFPLETRLADDVIGVDMCAMACQGFLSHARERVEELAEQGCPMRFIMNKPNSPAAREAAEYKISSGSQRHRQRIIPASFQDGLEWCEMYPDLIRFRVTERFLPCAIFIIRKKKVRDSTIKVDYYAFNCGDTARRSVMIPYADRENFEFYEQQFNWIWDDAEPIRELEDEDKETL